MEDTNVKSDLEISILRLDELLQSGESSEAKFQTFCEENPIVFQILGYRRFLQFTNKSGRDLPRDEYTNLKPEPDFITERENGLFEIFEIKTPVSKQLIVDSNIYRERFTSEVISYISQTITYENYFTRNPINRKKVNDLFDIHIHEDLDIKIVIGLNKYIDRIKIHQKCREYRYKIDIITYDDILNRLREEYNRLFRIYENLPGFSFHFVFQFTEQNKQRKSYIFDTGSNPDQNRISFFVEENCELCFRVIDNFKKTYIVSADQSQYSDEWIYLVCEFGKTTDGFIMTLGINGYERDKRVKNTIVNLDLSITTATLGCDLNQQNFGCFNIAEQLVFSQTLSFEAKYPLLNYINSKYDGLENITSWVEFNGSKFLYRDDKNRDFIQDKTEYKPIYRTTKK